MEVPNFNAMMNRLHSKWENEKIVDSNNPWHEPVFVPEPRSSFVTGKPASFKDSRSDYIAIVVALAIVAVGGIVIAGI